MSSQPPAPDDPLLPSYSLDFLSPSVQERITSTTPFRFHQPFPSSPSFVEPFIPIPSAPGQLELILSPARPSDLSAHVECLLDPRVSTLLTGPAGRDAFVDFSQSLKPQWDYNQRYFDALATSEGRDEMEWLIPVSVIRVKETGAWVGLFSIYRWNYREITGEKEQKKQKKRNWQLEIGDSRLVWGLGYCLHPRFQGIGIMTRVLSSVFKCVLMDYLEAKVVRTTTYTDNLASIRVQEKCGMKKKEGSEFSPPAKEEWSTRGFPGRREIVLEWRKEWAF
ncbi:GNAT family N-acetyltransferase [Sporobolomyces salmoneus]|uniref:GNAT family N-acetyltransferase n=1 Tax=Sporobolomyces salmoneus TaxID=183962 RepID=UPI0031733BD5